MITCDPKLNVYVSDSGAVVPRVSSICRLLDPNAFDFVSDSAMASASRRGTWVHEAIDRFHITGNWDCGDPNIDSITYPYRAGYLEFLSDTGAEPLEGEKVVSHRLYGYAGRLDKIYRIRGRLTVLDFKVTAAMPKTVWVQLAAYMEAFNDEIKGFRALEPVRGQSYSLATERAALRLRPNEKYQLRRPPEPFPEDLRVFLACLQLHSWKEKNNAIKPKF